MQQSLMASSVVVVYFHFFAAEQYLAIFMPGECIVNLMLLALRYENTYHEHEMALLLLLCWYHGIPVVLLRVQYWEFLLSLLP
jgi:hypothetical protein